jgi:hypothetical protein
VSGAKFRSLWPRSRSHIGVKVQIKKSLEMIIYIYRYFPDIAQRISPICISIMPTSLSKASVTGVYCDNVFQGIYDILKLVIVFI